MARPIAFRKVVNHLTGKLTPGEVPSDAQPKMFFTNPEGEDHITPLTAMGMNKSPFVENMRVSLGGRYVVRDGTYRIGAAAANPICGACIFIASTYVNYIVRVTTTGVEIYSGGGWIALTGPALSLNSTTIVEFSVWDFDLMFTDATSGLYTIDFNAGTYTLIPDAPIGLHLTTFDGRAILSNLTPNGLPSRIQWCVKNDNTDWTGLGSGYEDLLSSPGGVVDTQHAVIPVTDSEAFVVRASSLWIMNTTGYFDAPFQFTQHFPQGTGSPDTIVRIPGEKISEQTLRTLFAQIVLLGTDDVVMMKMEGVFPLGFPIRDQLLNNQLNANLAVADFEPRLREYRLSVPTWAGTETSSIVWRYNIDTHLWTHDKFPIRISRLFCGDLIPSTLSIGQLTGLISGLIGTFGTMGATTATPSPGALFVDSVGKAIVKEDSAYTVDVQSDGSSIGVEIELRTGLLIAPNPLCRAMIDDVQLEYEASAITTVEIDYSTDGGNSWLVFGTFTLAITTRPTVVMVRRVREAETLMLRAISTSAGGLKLHSLTPSLTDGSSINT